LLGTSLGVNICCRFNAVSINIPYKMYKSAKSPIVLQNDLANMQKNQMSLGHGWRNLFQSGKAQVHVKKVQKIFVV